MSGAAQGQLVSLLLIAALIGLGVARRIRPQPVRIRRLVIGGVAITLLILFSLVGTGGSVGGDPVALVLIPVSVAAGAVIGYYLVRSMTFWADPGTGQLWMRGGPLFAVILVGTIVIRFGVRDIVYGSVFGPSGGGFPAPGATGSHGLLYDLSADLLFLSLGLWLARAYFIWQRYRAHIASGGEATMSPPVPR